MTGIEKLRALARRKNYLEPAEAREIDAIADQIEREQDAMVKDSPYDALPPEDRDALAWVREHGGIAYVKEEWNARSNLKRSLETAQAKVERQQRHIMFVQGKCRERQEHIVELNKMVKFLMFNNSNFRALQADVAERLGFTRYGDDYEPDDLLDALDRRLVPEGVEWLVEAWPRFEGDTPVRFGDKVDDIVVRSIVFQETGVLVTDGTSLPGWNKWRRYKEPFPRPAPKVLDADGVEIYKGRIAYGTRGRKYRVTELCEYEPSIVHAQAIDDGELGDELIAANIGFNSYQLDASKLTHERPETDSWERLEEDAKKRTCEYFGHGSASCDGCPNESASTGDECEAAMARDIVRRAKKLAGEA